MPTENRSSNTEMVSVPREHELKIRQTPLADLLSGLKTGEIRDCSDRQFAVGDTVLLREIDDAREYTGTVLRRTITHVQKNYGLPNHLCVLSYGQPAEQHQGDAIGTLVRDYNERIVFTPIGDPHIIDDMKVYAHADPGDVDQLSQVIRDLNDERDEIGAEVGRLRAQLAERDALLRDLEGKTILSWPDKRRISAALSASAEPSAPECATCDGDKLVVIGFNSDAGENIEGPCPDCAPSAPVERDEHEGFSQACREAALAKGREIDPNALERRPDGSHVNPLVECGWWGWQARAALGRKPS